MPVALSRIKDAVQELRRPPLPERPRLPSVAIAHGRVSGAATFLFGALAAFLWANTTAAGSYLALRDLGLALAIGPFRLALDLRSFVNDGLMTFFFFSIGLAARRQIAALAGAGRGPVLVSAAAAAGALILPAALTAVIGRFPGFRLALCLGGFDLGLALAAFAVAHRSPAAGRHPLFFFSAAVDTGWILALALWGGGAVSWAALGGCAAVYAVSFAARWVGARGALWGALSGAALWIVWRRTGLPAPLAGVLLASLFPVRTAADERKATELAEDAIDGYDRAMDESNAEGCSSLARRLGDIAASAESPVDRWQTGLLPWLTWFVLPLFGWVNGGISLSGLAPVRPAVALALVFLLARPAGVFLLGWLVHRRSVEAGEPQDLGSLRSLTAISCAGGAPAVMGALIAFHASPAAEPFVLAWIALSLLNAAVGGVLLRRDR